jgi:starch phosphorylase
MQLKKKFIDFVKRDFKEKWIKNQGDPTAVMKIVDQINPNALIIGFARRFATYKRAHLLFTDLDRLAKIVNNEKFPVQFVFSGKAHPADGAGQGLIKRIMEISRMPQFLGKIIFLEDYNMVVAKRLITGVDIWLNTPTRPLEASGTSGEKAEMNGVLNFSVLDGWWYEGYRFDEKAGWALTDKRTFADQAQEDKLDAATIYSMLENEIVPLYFKTNSEGYSPEWIQYIKRSIGHIAPHFTMKRQLDDYIARFYKPEAVRVASLKKDDYAKARRIVSWKEVVASRWDQIEILSSDFNEAELANAPHAGSSLQAKCVIDTKGLNDAIGVELVVYKEHDGESKFAYTRDLTVTNRVGSIYTYELSDKVNEAGVFKYALRMYPRNEELTYRQDFAYVRWF